MLLSLALGRAVVTLRLVSVMFGEARPTVTGAAYSSHDSFGAATHSPSQSVGRLFAVSAHCLSCCISVFSS